MYDKNYDKKKGRHRALKRAHDVGHYYEKFHQRRAQICARLCCDSPAPVLALAFVLMWSYSSALMWVGVFFFRSQSYLSALALGGWWCSCCTCWWTTAGVGPSVIGVHAGSVGPFVVMLRGVGAAGVFVVLVRIALVLVLSCWCW